MITELEFYEDVPFIILLLIKFNLSKNIGMNFDFCIQLTIINIIYVYIYCKELADFCGFIIVDLFSQAADDC